MIYGHWIFNVEFELQDWFGFIYKITELDTNREYIGKKQFFNINRKIVKGKKNRKTVISESNWRVYTGSSVHLNLQISEKGKDNYQFEILSLHQTKGSLHYAEVEYQITNNVLREVLDDGVTKRYFNRAVCGVKFIPPALTPDELQIQICKVLTMKDYEIKKMSSDDYEKWLDENLRGANNPMFGRIPHNKGKTYEELYGVDAATKLKKLLSELTKQQISDGRLTQIKHHTAESKEKMSKAHLGKHTGDKNGMFGKPCYHNMTEQEIASWKANISKAQKGKPFPEKRKAAMKKTWENSPDRRKDSSIRRAEMNKSLSEEHKNATRQSNIKRGYETTRKNVESDVNRYVNITQSLINGNLVKNVAAESGSPYQIVWKISKNIDYYIAIIHDIKGTLNKL